MKYLVNGQILEDQDAVVSVLDRGFLYGDGLFETLPVFNQKPFRLGQHLQRLYQGATALNITLPSPPRELEVLAHQLIAANSINHAVLRIQVTRGQGKRGYSIRGANRPTLAMTLHDYVPLDPAQPLHWNLITASLRLSSDRLDTIKNCNKLMQILARTEAEDREADEALLVNNAGFVTEGSSSNLFWLEAETLCTPPLTDGVLPGITREIVLRELNKGSFPVAEKSVRREQLLASHGVFMTLSTLGIVPVKSLDSIPLPAAPLIAQLRQEYWRLVTAEGNK